MTTKNNIRFENQDLLPESVELQCVHDWLVVCLTTLNIIKYDLTYVILDNDDITDANNIFLNHNYPTDIITFNNSDRDEILEADMLLGIQTIAENAIKYKTSINNEFNRVCIHGILHLCGFDDKTDEEHIIMREQENKYLKYLDVPRGT